MRRCMLILPVLFLLINPLAASAQIYPPKPGVEIPQAYFDRIKDDSRAFQFQHAWIEKTARIKENRMNLIRNGNFNFDRGLSKVSAEGALVSGTASVPVFLSKFNNTGANPYPSANLQTELFTGPWPTGTMHDFYNEISYGNLNLTGTVYNWFQLAQNDTYYEGTQNGLGTDSKVGELLKETLDNWDPSVNFGIYDNDGPDGLPNSGDDDGYVDFVSFVHAEAGGECGNTNIWSHRWTYRGWWGAPYTTNDPRSGGGFIKVNDYTIQPALACDNVTMIQIGVFCHEFGHAFGLPDLYDTDGGSQGIGHWGLMGSGSWNTVTSPAHMCAWAKAELGWIVPTNVGPASATYPVNNVEFNPAAYKLNVYEERWRRSTLCALSGSYSMHMGLTAAEASARGWPGGAGYGNSWYERVARQFNWDGTTPVNLAYDYAYDNENGYDYGYLLINVNGTESIVRSYNGTGSGTESPIDLSSYLTGSGASYYYLIFEFDSDIAWSDEDGNYLSSCNGPFTVDNISLSGGGESYFTDFEIYEDGWFEDDNIVLPPGASDPGCDYFLVENRYATGFDQALHTSGLAIWHIDPDVAESNLGNTGGSSNTQTRGVKLMEADGSWDLMNGTNRGDAGDLFPGSTANTTFNNATTPSSLSNDGESTVVTVLNISAPGLTMSADMTAGAFPPSVLSILPSTGDNGGGVIAITDLLGSGINYGATFIFEDSLGGQRAASSVSWIGHGKLEGTIDLTGLIPGRYNVIIENPDGQQAVLVHGFIVTGPTGISGRPLPGGFALLQNHPNPFRPGTMIPFNIKEKSKVTLNIYDVDGRLVRRLVDRDLDARFYEEHWDGLNNAGVPVGSGVYFYRLTAGRNFVSVKKMVLLK